MNSGLIRALRSVLVGVLLAAMSVFAGPGLPANAATNACGATLLSGRSWLGGFGVDVKSNGTRQESGESCAGRSVSTPGVQFGEGWQCVELAQRLYRVRGWYGTIFPVLTAAGIYDAAPGMGMERQANGAITRIVPGDMIIHSGGGFGHVTIVDRVEGGTVHAVQQNSSSARIDYSWTSGRLTGGSKNVVGVVHSPNNRLSTDPVGSFDKVVPVRPGVFDVWGWAADPQQKNGSLTVRVLVDGAAVATVVATRPRADVHAAYPSYGTSLGFGARIALRSPGGLKNICIVGVNVGPGADASLGCRSVAIADADPFGSFDQGLSELGDIIWRGWAADPSKPAGPLHVSVWVNGTFVGWGFARGSRPDIAAKYSGFGANLGYAFRTVYRSGGNVNVCVKAANVGGGTPGLKVLGCKSLYVKTAADYYGKIVKWGGDTKAQKTSWYVDGQGRRHWIPDAKTYWCLRNHGAPPPSLLSARALDQLPDQKGSWAQCS